MDNEERRKADEAFKFRIIEQNAEIKALVSSTNTRIEELSKDITAHTVAIAEVRYAMWGGPKEADIGLLEKHRKLSRNWTIAMAVCAFLFSALGKIVSPLYNAAISSWAYNSVGERWAREQKRPKNTHYHIHEKITPPPETENKD